MKLPLRHTVPALIFTIGLAIILSAYAIERDALMRNLRNLADQQLRSTASFVAAELEGAFRARDTAAARATIERAATDRNFRLVILVEPGGSIRFANNPVMVGRRVTDIDTDTGILASLSSGNGSLEARITQLHEVGIVGGRFPVQMRGLEQDFLPDEFGRLYIVYDMSSQVARQQHELFLRMLPRTVVLAVLTLAFWFLFRRVLLHRINVLVESVRAVGKGDFTREPTISGHDELSELAAEITHMMRSLRSHTEQIAFLSDHDPLTGLLNRQGFEEEIDRARRYGYYSSSHHVVCLMDIDSLRVINDTQGHMAGDELLKAFGQMLERYLDQVIAVARVGGDEFAVLMETEDIDNLDTLAQTIQETIRNFRFSWNNDRFSVQASVGLVHLGPDIANAEEALGLADTACYVAKERGHGRYAIWQPETDEWSRQHGLMRWVARIQNALDEDRFVLHAQTIQPLAAHPRTAQPRTPTGRHGMHLEILVRMLDENGAIVPPGEFLGAAERYNLIGRIDRWVISNTLRWLRENPDSARQIGMCAINLSGLSFGDAGLLDEIRSELGKSRSIRPAQLCFEVTETAAITNLGHARDFIDTLRNMGCSFALDDFGSGVSSFGYLKHLPVDYIKIDGMFVRDIVADPADHAIVSAINSVAHQMGMKTIAEFAENRAIISALQRIGVDYAQGYGISRPRPLDAVASQGAIAQARH
jgi:diguanylate cyclase (GGDEF)-like protein